MESLARSRTAAARRVERARIVWRASQGETPAIIAETVRRRIRRFNAEGLAAFEDHPRSERPATYSADAVAAVIAAAMTSPGCLGLRFASWTLDHLAAYLLEHKGIAVRCGWMDETLLWEGLRWRRQEIGLASGSILNVGRQASLRARRHAPGGFGERVGWK